MSLTGRSNFAGTCLGAASLLAFSGVGITGGGSNERVFFDNMSFVWALRGVSPKHSDFFYFLAAPSIFLMRYFSLSQMLVFNPLVKKKLLCDKFGVIFDDSVFDSFSDILFSTSFASRRGFSGEDTCHGVFGLSLNNFADFSFYELPDAGAVFFFNQLDGVISERWVTRALSRSFEFHVVGCSHSILTFFSINFLLDGPLF